MWWIAGGLALGADAESPLLLVSVADDSGWVEALANDATTLVIPEPDPVLRCRVVIALVVVVGLRAC